jgi:zinc transport system substrate-binding protein
MFTSGTIFYRNRHDREVHRSLSLNMFMKLFTAALNHGHRNSVKLPSWFIKTLALALMALISTALLIIISSEISHAVDKKIKIVSSIAPLSDFARQIGGEKVDVVRLLPPGASPHTYEPTPKMIQEISRADIFIKVGAGLEFWADKIIKSVNREIETIVCVEGIDLIKVESHGYRHHDPAQFDPHIWLDPTNAIKIVRKIARKLSTVDPENSVYYLQNELNYNRSLNKLDDEIKEAVQSFKTKEFVAFHPAWQYFSRRYGLRIAAVIEEGSGQEPSPKHMNKILRKIRRMNIRIVFAETQFSSKIAEVIAQEAGGEVLFLDPIGGQKNRETYLEMMRYNVRVMERAMK